MEKYTITVECTTLQDVEVEAGSLDEAIELATQKARGACSGDSMIFYEVKQ